MSQSQVSELSNADLSPDLLANTQEVANSQPFLASQLRWAAQVPPLPPPPIDPEFEDHNDPVQDDDDNLIVEASPTKSVSSDDSSSESKADESIGDKSDELPNAFDPYDKHFDEGAQDFPLDARINHFLRGGSSQSRIVVL